MSLTLESWLARVRRRIRLRRGLRWALAGVIAWGGAALVILVAARLRPIGWEKPVVAGAAAVIVVAALTGLFRKLPRFLAARAADKDLSGADRIGTAVDLVGPREINPHALGLAPAQIADATRWATGLGVSRASPIRIPIRRGAVALGLSVAVSLLFLLPNPMEGVIERRRAEAALLRERAAELEKKAEQIKKSDIAPSEKKKLEEELSDLSKKLESSESIDQALKELAKTEGKLGELQKSDHLELKALTRAFERSVQDKPLASGLEGKTSEQLRGLADLAPQLSQAEKEDAAQRLEALAKSLENSDPETAAALAEAARALKENGDLNALRSAAESLEKAEARIAAQDQVASSRADLGELRDELAQAQEELQQGEGTRAGQSGRNQAPGGQGQQGEGGRGDGQQGQQGQQGQGQNAGQRGRGGAGSPSGTVSGANSPTAGPATGGQGTPAGSGNNPSTEVGESQVFDPIFGNPSERIQVEGDRQAGGRETTIGSQQAGGGTQGSVTVPYRTVYPAWSARAARTVQTLPIPASLRSYVRSYFASLAPEPAP